MFKSFKSEAMTAIEEHARRLARSRVSILITGPSGSGKNELARLIHRWSPRGHRELVEVDGRQLSGDTGLSKLVGHERGAFSGAESTVKGAAERAHASTLFIDEIGNAAADGQQACLKVMQGVVQRVGSTSTITVDARIVAATCLDLEVMVAAGEFRADLLARFPRWARIELPGIEERQEDVLPVARALAERRMIALGPGVERYLARRRVEDLHELSAIIDLYTLYPNAEVRDGCIGELRLSRLLETLPPMDGDEADLADDAEGEQERADVPETLRPALEAARRLGRYTSGALGASMGLSRTSGRRWAYKIEAHGYSRRVAQGGDGRGNATEWEIKTDETDA